MAWCCGVVKCKQPFSGSCERWLSKVCAERGQKEAGGDFVNTGHSKTRKKEQTYSLNIIAVAFGVNKIVQTKTASCVSSRMRSRVLEFSQWFHKCCR